MTIIKRFASFEEGVAEVERLIGSRNLEPAYVAAQQLSRQFSQEVQAYFLYNLVMCLGNYGGGARYATHILDEARRCPGFNAKVNGDMQRDRVIGLIRFAIDNCDLDLAERIIEDIHALHAGDLNRLACTQDVSGRLLYARKRYRDAVRAHDGANRSWSEMGNLADPVWVYNNKVHWLKAVVAAYGRNAVTAKRLEQEIRSSHPAKSPDRGQEARVIRGFPLGTGNLVHDWAVRHR